MTEWLGWMTDNPTSAAIAASGAAIGLVTGIVATRLIFAAIGRRVLVGLRLRKKVARESPWSTLDERVAYGLRPARRRRWAIRRRA
jgi:hypothetical protein